jgi:capsular polysaccharide transport system permease protein
MKLGRAMSVAEQNVPYLSKLILQEGGQVQVEEYMPRRRLKDRLVPLVRKNVIFLLCFITPVTLASVYYLFIAADMYISEARFIVRSSSISPRLGGTSGIGQVTTLVRTNDDTQSVNAYISSRDAMERLVREDNLLQIVNRPEADFLSRFPRFWSRTDREALFERLSDFLDISFDATTGVSTLYVRGFRPEDARSVALALLSHAEELINKLNGRARGDAIAFAEDIVARAEAKVNRLQALITDFRNREAIFDPVRQAEASLELIAKLTAEIAQVKATLAELGANSPDSPRIEAVRSRIRALQDQVTEQRMLIAGGDQSLAPKLAEYEKLTMERELATKSFVSALISLENAREEGHRKQLYLERIVEPNLPDQSLYPRRVASILYVSAICLAVYWILSVLGSVVLEHDL